MPCRGRLEHPPSTPERRLGPPSPTLSIPLPQAVNTAAEPAGLSFVDLSSGTLVGAALFIVPFIAVVVLNDANQIIGPRGPKGN